MARKRGPKRKPAESKKRAGTYRADRHDSVELPPGIPICPFELKAEAADHWHRLVGLLARAGYLSEIDGDALCILAELIARRWALYRSLPKSPVATSKKGGGKYLTPEWTALKMVDGQIEKLLVEFGMTPSARASLPPQEDGKNPNDPLDLIEQSRSNN